MIPVVTSKVTNYEKLDHALKVLPHEINVKSRRAGLVRAARPVMDDLKAYVPEKDGYLKASIGRKLLTSKDKSTLGVPADSESIVIGSVKKVYDNSGKRRYQGYKLYWLDQGVKPHVIKPKKYRFLRIEGRRHYGSVNHPGFNGRLLLRNAYQNNSSAIGSDFEKGVRDYLKRKGMLII